MKDEVTISWEKWECLTVKEKELLKALGLKPTGKRKVKGKKAKIATVLVLKPYTLGIKITCVICGSVTYRAFKMIQAVDKNNIPVLVPSEIESALYQYADKYEDRKTSSCSQCAIRLAALPKQEIIRRTTVCASCVETWRIEKYAGNNST